MLILANVKVNYLGKMRKKITILSSAEFAQGVIRVKGNWEILHVTHPLICSLVEGNFFHSLRTNLSFSPHVFKGFRFSASVNKLVL